MTILEGIKQEGQGRIIIPDTTRGDLPQFFKDMGYKIGVEIGVYKGDYMKQYGPTGMTMYGIDPWKAYGDYDQKVGKFQDRQDQLYAIAQETLKPFPNVTLIRKTSMEAVNEFEDESIDFVYIDGHHGFKYVAEDIWEWSKKVRKGGIVSGHDYGVLKHEKLPNDPYTCHVRYVVDAYTQACGIDKWFVLGRQRKEPGERGDSWRSWFWIKE